MVIVIIKSAARYRGARNLAGCVGERDGGGVNHYWPAPTGERSANAMTMTTKLITRSARATAFTYASALKECP
jgi:hypothetical protein